MIDDSSAKTLLDFMRPEPRSLDLLKPKAASSLGEKLHPSAKDTVLMLGYDGGAHSKEWMERGVDLLILCDREAEAVAARKEGIRAVLANVEYLWSRVRFDGIVTGSSSYRIYDPRRAMEALLQALKPEGILLLELRTGQLPERTERAIMQAAEALGAAHLVERVRLANREHWRALAEESGASVQTSALYRHRYIPRAKLEEWVKEQLESRALLLEEENRKALMAKAVGFLESELDGELALCEEEELLRLELRRS